MTLLKNTPASEAGAEDKNKAISNGNYIGTAQKLLQAFSKDAQYFCGFTDKKLPIGKGLQPNQTKYGIKLSELNPAELWSIEEIRSFKKLPFNFLGLPLNKKDGSKVVCLDFDGKNASDSSLFASYRNFAEKQGYLVETSLSGKGFHVFFKTDAEMPSEKWCFSDGLELEFFPHQSAKAILLTGKDLKGELKNVENPLLELKQQGLHEPKQAPTESTLKPRVSVFSEDDVDRVALAPENMASWVPIVFPSARCTPDGRWRVSSADLGRDLEEDLSISENGIKDFGLHDLPDQFNKGKFTPTQLVAEWKFGGDKYWKDSRDWLREVCGMPAFSKHAKNGDREAEQGNPWLERSYKLGSVFKAPRTIIKGFLPDGIINIAGQGGIGKTSALIPLALVVADIRDSECELESTAKRNVIYISEDPEQVELLLQGFCKHSTKPSGGKWTIEEIADRFRLIPALRSSPEKLALLADLVKARVIQVPNAHGELIDLYPLVVFDTKSAIFAMDDENSNSETSKYIATIKENISSLGAPVWIVSHLAKESFGRKDFQAWTARGASSNRDDANATAILFKDEAIPSSRFLALDKRRLEVAFTEIEIQSETHSVISEDYMGYAQTFSYRYSTIRKSAEELRERNAQSANAEAERVKVDALKIEILNLVASVNAEPEGWINRAGVKKSIKRNAKGVTSTIAELLELGELEEVAIPDHYQKTRNQETMLVLNSARNANSGNGVF